MKLRSLSSVINIFITRSHPSQNRHVNNGQASKQKKFIGLKIFEYINKQIKNVPNLSTCTEYVCTCLGKMLPKDIMIKSIAFPPATVNVFKACKTALMDSGACNFLKIIIMLRKYIRYTY